MNTLVVGLQYGDEGKGRVSHILSQEHDWAIRFNGGPNAGHTVYHNGTKHKLHHLPAGAVLGKKVALDTGMVINFEDLVKECQINEVDLANLFISENVHLIQSQHLLEDADGSGVGSTKKGISQTYADRARRGGS